MQQNWPAKLGVWEKLVGLGWLSGKGGVWGGGFVSCCSFSVTCKNWRISETFGIFAQHKTK